MFLAYHRIFWYVTDLESEDLGLNPALATQLSLPPSDQISPGFSFPFETTVPASLGG